MKNYIDTDLKLVRLITWLGCKNESSVTYKIVTQNFNDVGIKNTIEIQHTETGKLETISISELLQYPDYFQASHATAYQIVFDPTLWFVMSSCIAALVGEFINNYYIFKWKLKYNGHWFILRCIISIALGQAVLTILVDLMAFGHKYPLSGLSLLMLHGYLLKMTFTALLVIPSWLIVRHLKNLGIDSYETSRVSINPFHYRNSRQPPGV